jgi:Putative transposase
MDLIRRCEGDDAEDLNGVTQWPLERIAQAFERDWSRASTWAAETLATIAADPKHLGAQLGMTMVLDAWGQTLQHHPHVHCVVPGGGPSLDGTRWVACRPGFFLPVRVLARLFRRLFLRELENAFDAGNLRFFNNLANLARSQVFARHLAELRRTDWGVYAKPPFGGSEQALA